MELQQGFARLMETTRDIALATAVDNVPNVRIVNFHYDPTQKIVYFASFKGQTKSTEFERNNKVAFTTIPHEASRHVRVTNAIINNSGLTIYDLKDEFIRKNPGYETLIANAGGMMEVYEIRFNEAQVILDLDLRGTITI